MTARIIANRLLEADEDNLDISGEIERLTTAPPGYEIESEGNHWNVYKIIKPEKQPLQHTDGTDTGLQLSVGGRSAFIGEIYYDDMSDAPVEAMTPESRAYWNEHRWMSIAGFRDSEQQPCKSFDEAIQWIIAVNATKTAPVRESEDPDDPAAYIEKFAQERSVPATTTFTNIDGRRWLVEIVWNEAEGGHSFDAEGNEVPHKPYPIVKFYDLTHGGRNMVSSYFASTLVERPEGQGLALHGNEPAWTICGRIMDQLIPWIRKEVEGRGYKLVNDEANGVSLGLKYESVEPDDAQDELQRFLKGRDPDDPDLYLHPERFNQQPSDEKIEGALRRMLAPYYTRVSVNKRPGMFAGRVMTQRNIPDQPGVVHRTPLKDSFIWTIHCNRDTPLPLSLVNRAMPGYDLDWRQEVKHWFEKWASQAGLSLLKFEIYGRLRKDPTFQFETVRMGPLKEGIDDPEEFLAHHVAATNWDKDLELDLREFHPYGVYYQVIGFNRGGYVHATTYFEPNKDNFAERFREYTIQWLQKRKIMPLKYVKLHSFRHANSEDYPRWSVIASVNVPWADPDLPEHSPTVEIGQPVAPVDGPRVR